MQAGREHKQWQRTTHMPTATVAACSLLLWRVFLHSAAGVSQRATHLAGQRRAPDVQQVQLLALAGGGEQCRNALLTVAGAGNRKLLQVGCNAEHGLWKTGQRRCATQQASDEHGAVSKVCAMLRWWCNRQAHLHLPAWTLIASAMLVNVLLPRWLLLRFSRWRHSACFSASPRARPPTSLTCTSMAAAVHPTCRHGELSSISTHHADCQAGCQLQQQLSEGWPPVPLSLCRCLLGQGCQLCGVGVAALTWLPSSSRASSGTAAIMPARARAALSPSLLKDRSSCFKGHCRPAPAIQAPTCGFN